jgi:hypothetical protein
VSSFEVPSFESWQFEIVVESSFAFGSRITTFFFLFPGLALLLRMSKIRYESVFFASLSAMVNQTICHSLESIMP